MKNNLRKILWEKDLTQEELSQKSGVSQPEISRIITGKKKGLQLDTAKKIARALDRPIEEIWPD